MPARICLQFGVIEVQILSLEQPEGLLRHHRSPSFGFADVTFLRRSIISLLWTSRTP
jgi:hypothetical protein